MKKLILIMMAFMASFGAFAQEANTTSENNEEAIAIYSIPTFTIDISEVVYPFVIDVPAPAGTILGVSGPTDPLLQTWRVENGRLIIELYEEDLCDVRAGNTHWIEYASTEEKCIIKTSNYLITFN